MDWPISFGGSMTIHDNSLASLAELDTTKANDAEVTAALALKAPLESPALTGDPTAPTPIAGDNDTSIATTAYVQTELISGATAAGIRAWTLAFAAAH